MALVGRQGGRARAAGLEQREMARGSVDLALQCLRERDRALVVARFGLVPGSKPRTMEDIAHEIGRSRERVRQILLRALTRLIELGVTPDMLATHATRLRRACRGGTAA